MKLVEAYNNHCRELGIQHLVPYVQSFELERDFSLAPKATLKLNFTELGRKYDMSLVIEALKKLKEFQYKNVKVDELEYQGINVDMTMYGEVIMQVNYRKKYSSYSLGGNGLRLDGSILNTPTITASPHTHSHDTIWTAGGISDLVLRTDDRHTTASIPPGHSGDSHSFTSARSASGTINLDSLSDEFREMLRGN